VVQGGEAQRAAPGIFSWPTWRWFRPPLTGALTVASRPVYRKSSGHRHCLAGRPRLCG